MRLISRPLPGMLVLEAEAAYRPARLLRPLLLPRTSWRPRADTGIEQANLSFSERAGTLRGLHYQLAPSAETKVVTCLQGALHDVVLDLRPESPSYRAPCGGRASPENRRVVVVPEGCAHGFLTLADATLLLYLVTAAYDPVRERAVRWDDPGFAIAWPAGRG